MARILLCEIVTPERIVYTNEVEMIVAPALDGELGILPLHAPMVAALKAGEVRAKYDSRCTRTR
jgi:F-type H+-transporting ATPase subunit epsilon